MQALCLFTSLFYAQVDPRFLILERNLDRQHRLREQYSAFIQENVSLNHRTLVSFSGISSCKYFLPHHCGLKDNSKTTHFGVVIDGSAISSSGQYLNEALLAAAYDRKLINMSNNLDKVIA